jgi:predicted RNA polymerase sigma factor
MPGNPELSMKKEGGRVGKRDRAAIIGLSLLELEFNEEYMALEGTLTKKDLCQSGINLAQITHGIDLTQVVVNHL